MNGLQQMVGGLLSYGVSHIHNPNIKSWQVLFMMVRIYYLGVLDQIFDVRQS
jgi:UDP-N-acetylmuramyl pentapeptide phosphotransferase/UDP-N-acetylglucosamine-1-phosphate transferase